MSKAHIASMVSSGTILDTASIATVPASRSSVLLRSVIVVLAGSALAAITARVSVPLYFTPVPLSLQPFAVLLLGLLLSPQLTGATFAAYLAEGALGLPVFAPTPLASGGLAHLLGPTGGYLFAYPLAAMLISYLWRRATPRTGRSFTAAVLSAATGDLVILVSGALWLAAFTHFTGRPAMTLAVLPFLPGDVLKIAAAASLAVGFLRLRSSMSSSHTS